MAAEGADGEGLHRLLEALADRAERSRAALDHRDAALEPLGSRSDDRVLLDRLGALDQHREGLADRRHEAAFRSELLDDLVDVRAVRLVGGAAGLDVQHEAERRRDPVVAGADRAHVVRDRRVLDLRDRVEGGHRREEGRDVDHEEGVLRRTALDGARQLAFEDLEGPDRELVPVPRADQAADRVVLSDPADLRRQKALSVVAVEEHLPLILERPPLDLGDEAEDLLLREEAVVRLASRRPLRTACLRRARLSCSSLRTRLLVWQVLNLHDLFVPLHPLAGLAVFSGSCEPSTKTGRQHPHCWDFRFCSGKNQPKKAFTAFQITSFPSRTRLNSITCLKNRIPIIQIKKILSIT